LKGFYQGFGPALWLYALMGLPLLNDAYKNNSWDVKE